MSPWRRSLRVRLTSGFAIFAAVTIGIAATAVVLLIEQTTLGELDTVLLEEARTLATLADLPGAHLDGAVRDVGQELDTGGRKFVRVTAADGAVRAGWKKVPRVVSRRHLDAESDVFSAGEDDAMFRVAMARTPSGGRVLVGVNATRHVRLVQRARFATAFLSAILLTMLAVGAWIFTGRATREIERLAGEVATIEAGTLERRLSPRDTVEVDRLVTILNRVLERLERSVGQMRRFSADAAHELRTPLAALRARLEVGLRREGPDVPRDVVVDALEQAERLGRLAEDLLTLTRLEGGVLTAAVRETPIELGAMIEEVGTALLPLAEEQGRRFRWETAPDVTVRGSEPLLKRVVVNLLDNAFRHTTPMADVVLRTERDGDEALIVVHDGGPGIPADIVPHVFERFRHGPGTGAGLGLALVREIVARHGGTVVLDSRPGAGTTVRVRLPADASRGADGQRAARA